MARYRCPQCDARFEHSAGPLRCPTCLRQHGLEAVSAPTPPARKRTLKAPSRRVLIAALLLVCGLGALGFLLQRHQHAVRLPARGELAILDEGQLRRTLLQRGLAAADVQNPFTESAALRELARSGGGSTPLERAHALAGKLGKLIGPHLVVELKGREVPPPRDAAQLLAALDRGEVHRALSFELAALATALLRAADVRAVLCEASRLKAPVASADLVGGIGRYVVAIYPAQGTLRGLQPLLVLDPARAGALPVWAGGGAELTLRSLAERQLQPLDDASAAAHLLALKAYQLRERAPKLAYRLSALALEAAAPSATLRLLRAKVLMSAGGLQDARREAEQALALADAAPPRAVLALALAAEGAVSQAMAHLELALQRDARYWPARLALATLLADSDPPRAARHLAAAFEVAPEEPELLLFQASRLLREEKTAEAVSILRHVVAQEPQEDALLLLYQALAQLGEAREAAAVRARLLAAIANPQRRQQTAQALEELGRPSSAPSTSLPRLPARPPKLTLPDVSLHR